MPIPVNNIIWILLLLPIIVGLLVSFTYLLEKKHSYSECLLTLFVAFFGSVLTEVFWYGFLIQDFGRWFTPT